jgi:peptidoglycan/LPS O-acetylase OafA/YrhL
MSPDSPVVVPQAGRWIDTLRGASSAAVVLFHINEIIPYHPHPYLAIVKHGGLGVPVFFVISGYLIIQTALSKPDWLSFCVRRWWRIYPPYVASVALVISVAVLRKLSTGTNNVVQMPQGPLAWLATLTLSTSPVSTIPPLNWVYWSLSCEFAFYGVVALCLALWRGRLPLAICVITFACVIPGLPPFTRFFTENWAQFALGATLALGLNKKGSWLLFALCLVSFHAFQQPKVSLVALITWSSIAWSRLPSGAWLNRELFLSRLGIVSYSLYLTHVPLGVYLFARIRPASSSTNMPLHLACDGLIFALCAGSAWLFWNYVEHPAHNRGRAWKPNTDKPV